MIVQRFYLAPLLTALLMSPVVRAQPVNIVDAVKAAGRLPCGTIEATDDWNGQDQHGDLSSLGAAVCRAVAVAILGDADKTDLVSFPAEPEALTALHDGRLALVVGISPSAEAAMQWQVAFGPPFF